MFNTSTVSANFAIRNNHFDRIRRYGNIIRASSGVIEDNLYEYISDVPIIFRNEPDNWRNGLQSTDILIRRNKIINSGFSGTAKNTGQIQMSLFKLGPLLSEWRGHRRIVIEDNEIINWQERGIVIRNASDVLISGNEINAAAGVTFNNNRPHYGIELDNVGNVLCGDNIFSDPRDLDDEIFISGNTSNITVRP